MATITKKKNWSCLDMPKLDDNTLISILDRFEGEARNSLTTRIKEDNEITRRYNAELYGDEIEGHSQVVSEDVKDTIESDLPSLIRVLLNSGPICKFKAKDPSNEQDVKEAQEKTDYADHLVRGLNDSYKINYDFIKSVAMYKHGVVKYIFDEEKKVEVEEFDVPVGGEVRLLQMIESTPHYLTHETLSVKPTDEGNTYKVRIETSKKELKIIQVPNESFLISKGAKSLEDALMVGDITTKTRGELVAEGHSRELVSKLSRSNGNTEGATSKQLRFSDQGDVLNYDDYGVWANESVEVVEMYVMIDYDQDGIAERRRILKSGQFILENELFNHVPYATASAIPVPYNAIGDGRAKQVLNIQRVKTSLERGLLDNTYAVNNPETHVNANVNQEDLMSDDIGKIVRHKGESLPANNIQGVTIPYVGDKALLAIQQQDAKKAKLVGNQIASQGLTADDVNNETATRFKGVEKAEAAKLELVVRNIAEMGYRKLYSGLIWMAQKFESNPAVINKQGQALNIDPSKWALSHDLDVEVGLGTGNSEESVENLTALWNIHTQLKAEQSPLTDDEKRYNILSDLIKQLELRNGSRYVNNPTEPDELIRFQNEQLNNAVLQQQAIIQQLTEQVESLQALSEVEMIKAQSKAQTDNKKVMVDAAKLQEQKRQFDIKMGQDAEQHEDDIALDVTELELKYGQQQQV